jgi:hypothetical protein
MFLLHLIVPCEHIYVLVDEGTVTGSYFCLYSIPIPIHCSEARGSWKERQNVVFIKCFLKKRSDQRPEKDESSATEHEYCTSLIVIRIW